MSSSLTLVADKGLPCLSTIEGYTGPLHHAAHNLPHPAVLITKSWGNLAKSVTSFLDIYESSFISENKNEAHGEVSKAYEDVLYNAAELVETLTVKLPTCLLPKNKRKQWKPDIPKRWTRHIVGICNQLKHEHNHLVCVDVISAFGIARGYSLCRYESDAVKPNKNFHESERAFAYGTDLRRIMAHIYLIANAVNDEFTRLLEPVGQVVYSQPEKELELLLRITEFMPLPFHFQKSKNTPIFSLKKGVLTLADSGGYLIPLGKNVQVVTRHNGDGRTKTFEFI